MKGIITALVTPFDRDGRLLEEGLREVVRHNIDRMQVDGLYVGGSTGEAFLMSEADRRSALSIVKEEAGDAVTLIAQIGSLDIEEAKRLGLHARDLGYEAISAITPYYYRFSFEEVRAYYETLDEAIGHPMIVYANPSMAGANFDIEKYRQLLAIEGVVGIKFSDADIAKFERLRNAFPDDLLYFGYDEIALVGFTLGCDGVIGSTYNVMGDLTRRVQTLVGEGKCDQARKMQHQIASVIEGIVANSLYPTIKALITAQGAEAGYCKFPFAPLDQRQEENIPILLEAIEKLRR